MAGKDYSTLWEFGAAWQGTKNHASTGGSLVIMSKHFAGITPLKAGYEKVEINPQYTLQDSMTCTVPTVKGLNTLDYKKTADNYVVNLTVPDGMKAVLYAPTGAVVNIITEPNGEHINNDNTDVEVVLK